MSHRNDGAAARESAARWLIQQAARRAPPSLAARLEEEWLADLESRPTGFSKMGFALGCCWALAVISRDRREQTPAGAAMMTADGTRGLRARHLRYLTLRPATLFLILGLHATLLYGLASVLSQSPELAAPVQTQTP